MALSEPVKATLILHRDEKEFSLDITPGDRVMDLLDGIGVPMDGVLVFRDGSPVPLDMEVREKMVLTVIRVASGG